MYETKHYFLYIVYIFCEGTRGAELRTLLSSTLELGFEIDSENKSVKLRGTQENVLKGLHYFICQFTNRLFLNVLNCQSIIDYLTNIIRINMISISF